MSDLSAHMWLMYVPFTPILAHLGKHIVLLHVSWLSLAGSKVQFRGSNLGKFS